MNFDSKITDRGSFMPTHELLAERRTHWGAVLKGATLFTAMAIEVKDWAKARQGEELMSKASNRAGLDMALISALFGPPPVVDMSNRFMAACFDAGMTASDEQVAQAREVVRANKASREAKRAKRAVQNSIARAVHAETRVARASAKEQAATERALKEAEAASAYAAKKAAFDAAVASEAVQSIIARFNGFEGLVADVQAAAEFAIADLNEAGVATELMAAMRGATWGRLKLHISNCYVCVIADETRDEPTSMRRASHQA